MDEALSIPTGKKKKKSKVEQLELSNMPKKPMLDKEASEVLDARHDVQEAQKVLADKIDNMICAMRREQQSRYTFHNDIDGEKVFTLNPKEVLRVKRATAGSRPRNRKM